MSDFKIEAERFFKELMIYEGKIDRLRFFFYVFTIGFVQTVLIIVLWSIFDFPYFLHLILWLLIFGGGGVLSVFQVIKRLRDIGRPEKHAFFLLIPFFNLYIAILLFFKKGNRL